MKLLIKPYLVLLELALCSLICVPGVWANLTLFIDRPGDSEVCLAPGSLFMISGRVFAFDYAAEQYGTVTKVEIYQGLEKLGDALLDNPNGYCHWRFPWNPVSEGSNTIHAIGFSSLGVETATVAVVFIITNNTPPIARDVRAQVTVNATSHVINATYSDVDFDQFWSASVVDPPSHGSISNGPPGTMTFYYTPYTGYGGSDSFTYQVDDSITNSNLATGRILAGSLVLSSQLVDIAQYEIILAS